KRRILWNTSCRSRSSWRSECSKKVISRSLSKSWEVPASRCDGRKLSLGTNATFRRIGSVPRSASVRRPEEQGAPVGERQIPAVCPVCAVLGQITLDLDLRSRLQVLLSQASSEQCVWGTAFDHPLFQRPVRLLDVDVDPGVGIDPFHFRDHARQLDGPVRVKFRGEGVMCRDRNGRQNQETHNTNRDDGQPRYHGIDLLLLLVRLLAIRPQKQLFRVLRAFELQELHIFLET